MKGLHVLTVLFFVAFATGIFAQTVPTAAVSEFQSQYIVDIRTEVHDHDNGRMLFDDYTGNLVGNQYVLTVASSLLVEEGAQTTVIIKAKDKVIPARMVAYLREEGVALFLLGEKVTGYFPFQFAQDMGDELYVVTSGGIFQLPLRKNEEKVVGAAIVDDKGQLVGIVLRIDGSDLTITPWPVIKNIGQIIDAIEGQEDKSREAIRFDKI